MHLNILHVYTALFSLAAYAVALPKGPLSLNGKMARSVVPGCADSTLARTMFEGFAGSITAHSVDFHVAFVHDNTARGSAFWTLQGPVCRAWQTQQPFTVPLYAMLSSAGNDIIFRVGTDASAPPIVSGYTATNINTWVYATAICGSVPLMSAVFPSQTDHYYTIDPEEHARLLSVGWSDSGVVAYVLPLIS